MQSGPAVFSVGFSGRGRPGTKAVTPPHLALSRYNLEPQRGFEPLTCRLQIDCASFAPQGHPILATAPAPLKTRNGPTFAGPFQHRVTANNYSQPRAAASIETRCTKSGIRTAGPVVVEGDPVAECRLRAWLLLDGWVGLPYTASYARGTGLLRWPPRPSSVIRFLL